MLEHVFTIAGVLVLGWVTLLVIRCANQGPQVRVHHQSKSKHKQTSDCIMKQT